ncbi:Fic family protein [Actinomyces israelii]|uniref:Fic family protein n=1 Tax=Actinomyces israelii TaxID=1659 RepID=UPI003C6C95CC
MSLLPALLVSSELNAIHPFRESNGRTIRLFLSLPANRSGWDPQMAAHHRRAEPTRLRRGVLWR